MESICRHLNFSFVCSSTQFPFPTLTHPRYLVEVPERSEWKPDLALALIQGLASADFEGKTGTTAEDMTIASFACHDHGERFRFKLLHLF